MRRPVQASVSASFTVALLFLTLRLGAHDPVTTKLTWTREISRIVDKHCLSCHIEFAGYQTARPWAKGIRDEVISRRMPPWGAVKGVGEFAGDPSLSGPEVEMLVAWVEGGAPEGDPAFLPHLRTAGDTPAVLPHYEKVIAVQRELILKAPSRVVALKPQSLRDRASLEAWAIRPDGEVDRLIWLADYRAAWPRNYIVRDPALFPAGTRLKVKAPQGTALTFFLR